ncbi:hypothetical protein JRY02_05870 [Enterobacter roggenkampii]|nr:hypothetical protein [Enterobacter roggenkampii]
MQKIQAGIKSAVKRHFWGGFFAIYQCVGKTFAVIRQFGEVGGVVEGQSD